MNKLENIIQCGINEFGLPNHMGVTGGRYSCCDGRECTYKTYNDLGKMLCNYNYYKLCHCIDKDYKSINNGK